MAVDLNTLPNYPFCTNGEQNFLEVVTTFYIPFYDDGNGRCNQPGTDVTYQAGNPETSTPATQEIKLCPNNACKATLYAWVRYKTLPFDICAQQYYRTILWIYDPNGNLVPGTGEGGTQAYDPQGSNYQFTNVSPYTDVTVFKAHQVNYTDPNAFGVWTLRITVSLCSNPDTFNPSNVCEERFFDFLVTDGCNSEETTCYKITPCASDSILNLPESFNVSNPLILWENKYVLFTFYLEALGQDISICALVEKISECTEVYPLLDDIFPGVIISENIYDECPCQDPCDKCPPGFNYIEESDTCEKETTVPQVLTEPTELTPCITSIPLIDIIPNSNYNLRGALIYDEVLNKDLPLILTPQNVSPDSNLQCTNSEIPQPGPDYVATNPGNYASGYLPCPLSGNRHDNVNVAVPVIWPDTIVPGLINSLQITEFQKTVFRSSPIVNIPPLTKYLGQGAPLKALAAVLGPPWVEPGNSWMNRVGKTGKNGGLIFNSTQTINYGYLYNWHALTNNISGDDGRGTRGIVNINTSGNWRVPTRAEWDILFIYLDPLSVPGPGVQSSIVGGQLKAPGISIWSVPNPEISSQFFQVPVGVREGGSGNFNFSGTTCQMWTSDENFVANGFLKIITNGTSDISEGGGTKKQGVSVRLFRDASVSELLLADGTWVFNTYLDSTGNYYNGVKIGTQVWLTENLREEFYNDGTPIPNLTLSGDWITDTSGAYCSYNNVDPLESSVTNINIIVPEQQDNVWYGVTKMLVSPVNRITHLAISSDNSFRVSFNNKLLIEANVGDGNKPTFTFAHLFKLTIPAGTHVMKLETLNYSGNGGFAYQLLDADLPEILSAGTQSDLDDLSVFSSKQDSAYLLTDSASTPVFSCWTCPEGTEPFDVGPRGTCISVESLPASPGCDPDPEPPVDDPGSSPEPELKIRCIEPGTKTEGCVPNSFTKKDCDTSCH